MLNRIILAGVLTLTLIVGSVWSVQAAQNCGTPLITCTASPVQFGTIVNSETTGAATTAVTVTLAAVPGARAHVYSIAARCNTASATSSLLISDGGATIWSSGLLAVTNVQPQYFRDFNTPITSVVNSQVLITLAACTAGTGTLIVQTDKY